MEEKLFIETKPVRVSHAERAVIREQKRADKLAAKEQARQDHREQKAWEKCVERWKACGAWVEE